jgi:hypothetical protein
MDVTTAFHSVLHYTQTGMKVGLVGGTFIGSLAIFPYNILSIVVALVVADSMINGNADNFLAELPYFELPTLEIILYSRKIRAEAARFGLPPELLSAVLMYEMYQIHIGDDLFDYEVFTGDMHSMGIAQLRIDNVRDWCPSTAALTDAEIRRLLISPDTSIELLAEAMNYWRTYTTSGIPEAHPTLVTWATYTQDQKELSVALYSSAKDSGIMGLDGAPSEAGIRFGRYGLRRTQTLMSMGLF